MIVGVVMMLLLWGGLIALAVAVIRALSGTASRPSGAKTAPSESPLDILKKRYASGEISKAEYEEMRRDLQA